MPSPEMIEFRNLRKQTLVERPRLVPYNCSLAHRRNHECRYQLIQIRERMPHNEALKDLGILAGFDNLDSASSNQL